jgi:hypothetical protein
MAIIGYNQAYRILDTEATLLASLVSSGTIGHVWENVLGNSVSSF